MDKIEHLKLLQETAVRLRRLAAVESSTVLGRRMSGLAAEIEDDAKMLEAEMIEAGLLRRPPTANTN
jgi:hypothetical protein